MSIPYKNHFFEQYKHDTYSQNGEDGVLSEILNRLELKNGYVCEFGAWNGHHLSNTFNLVSSGWKAVYIESDTSRYNDLLNTRSRYPNIIAINALVSHDDKSEFSLDNILSQTNIPLDFDVLSVDVDSFDYQIWKATKKYRPKVVIIEINSGADPRDRNHIHTPGVYQGTGFKPMFDLAVEKGYEFVCHSGNMFFVLKELYSKLHLSYSNPLENFRRKWIGWAGISI